MALARAAARTPCRDGACWCPAMECRSKHPGRINCSKRLCGSPTPGPTSAVAATASAASASAAAAAAPADPEESNQHNRAKKTRAAYEARDTREHFELVVMVEVENELEEMQNSVENLKKAVADKRIERENLIAGICIAADSLSQQNAELKRQNAHLVESSERAEAEPGVDARSTGIGSVTFPMSAPLASHPGAGAVPQDLDMAMAPPHPKRKRGAAVAFMESGSGSGSGSAGVVGGGNGWLEVGTPQSVVYELSAVHGGEANMGVDVANEDIDGTAAFTDHFSSGHVSGIAVGIDSYKGEEDLQCSGVPSDADFAIETLSHPASHSMSTSMPESKWDVSAWDQPVVLFAPEPVVPKPAGSDVSRTAPAT